MIKTSSRWTLIEGFNTWGKKFCGEAETGRPTHDSSTPLSRNPALFSSMLVTTIHCVRFLTPLPTSRSHTTLPVQIEHEVTDWRFIWPWRDFSRPSFPFAKSWTRRILIRALNLNMSFRPPWMPSRMEQSPWLRLCFESKVAQVRVVVFFYPCVTHQIFIRLFPSNQKQATTLLVAITSKSFDCMCVQLLWTQRAVRDATSSSASTRITWTERPSYRQSAPLAVDLPHCWNRIGVIAPYPGVAPIGTGVWFLAVGLTFSRWAALSCATAWRLLSCFKDVISPLKRRAMSRRNVIMRKK